MDTGLRPEGTRVPRAQTVGHQATPQGHMQGCAPRARSGLSPEGQRASPRGHGAAPRAHRPVDRQRATPRTQRATPRGHRRLHTRLRPGAQGYAPRTQTVGHQATPRGRTQGHAPRAPNGLSPTGFGRNAKAPNLVPCQTHRPPPQGVGVWRRPSAPRRDPKSEKNIISKNPHR